MADPYAAFASDAASGAQDDPYAAFASGAPVQRGGGARNFFAGVQEGLSDLGGKIADIPFDVGPIGMLRHAAGVAEALHGGERAVAPSIRPSQTGQRASHAVAQVTGFDPEEVPATTFGEKVTRSIGAALPTAFIPVGSGSMTVGQMLKNASLASASAVGATTAAEIAPEPYKEVAALAGGIATGMGAAAAARAARRVGGVMERTVAPAARPDAELSAELGVEANPASAARTAEILRNRASNPQTVADMLRSAEDIQPHERVAYALQSGRPVDLPTGGSVQVVPAGQAGGFKLRYSSPGNAIQEFGPEGGFATAEEAATSAVREAFPDAGPIRPAPGGAELVPGSRPTTFQASGDMGLGSLEREQATKNPALFKEREAEQQAARSAALQNIQQGADPEAVATTVRAHLQALDDQHLQTVEAATEAAQGRARGLEAAREPEAIGGSLRQTIAEAEDTARQAERGLWNAVDPNNDLMGNVSTTRQAASEIAGEMPKTAKPMEGEEAGIFEAAQGLKPLAPVSELIALRSRVSDAMRNELMRNGRTATYARLTRLRGAIQDNLSNTIAHQISAEENAVARGAMEAENTLGTRLNDWIDQWRAEREQAAGAGGGGGPDEASAVRPPGGVADDGATLPPEGGLGGPEGDQGLPGGPTFDEAAAERLKAATEATKARARTFGMEPVSPTIAKAGAADLYKLPEARVPEKFFHPGKESFGHVIALYNAIGREPAVRLLSEYAGMSLRRAAMRPDGTLDPAKYQRWSSQHQDALRALPPEVRAGFSDMAQATRLADEAQASRVAAVKEAQTSAVKKLLGAEDADEVTKRIGNILGSPSAAADIGALVRITKDDPAARAGLRQAVADHMLSRVLSNGEAGTSGIQAVKGDTFANFFKGARPALAKLLTEDELGLMERVAQDIQRARRSQEATKLPGGSNTAQDLYGVAKNTGTTGAVGNSILGFLTERLTTIATHNPVAGVLAGLGTAVTSAMRDAGLRNVDQLLTHAMLNPEVARAILLRFPNEPNGRSAMRLADALKRSAMSSAAVAQQLTPKPPLEPEKPKPLVKPTLGLGIRTKATNPDGSISTVRTISIGTDKGEVLIPTVIKGRVVSDQAAVDHFRRTNEHLGIFRTPEEATRYAEWLHKRHERLLGER